MDVGYTILFVFVAGFLFVFWRSKQEAKQEEFSRKVDRFVYDNVQTLARRKLMLSKKDAYGVVDDKAWRKDFKHFVEKVLCVHLFPPDGGGRAARDFLYEATRGSEWDRLQKIIDFRVAEIREKIELPADVSPAEFETWVARRLEEQGWQASATQLTGDQGCDVLARKGPETLAIQCKLYTSPVGNKAVQEAHAAKAHYFATACAVVTNSRYTPSATKLAQSTGVLLLHHSDLERIDDLIAAAKNGGTTVA
jgi:restriction system protein